MKEEKFVTINRRSRKFYTANAEVKLSVQVKNVQLLTVSEFAVDLETYYRKKLDVFDTSIELEGILPQ